MDTDKIGIFTWSKLQVKMIFLSKSLARVQLNLNIPFNVLFN